MGEAKKRGTLEERIQQGILKKTLEAKNRQEVKIAYEASLTPRQKQKIKDSNLLLTSAMIISNSFNKPG